MAQKKDLRTFSDGQCKSRRASNRGRSLRISIALAALLVIATAAEAGFHLPNLFPFLDKTGFSATNSTTGSINPSGPFFQKLGTNGRTCGTCHQPSNAFGLSAQNAQLRYVITHGKDPLFDQVDGSTCPTGAINNSLVVNNGLIRIGLQVPPNDFDPDPPQYTITARPGSLWLRPDHKRPGATNGFGLSSTLAFDKLGFLKRGDV